ncbi:MAG: ATP synthase F0 subunit B [Oscillospiraceae bacterium]|nr:ATP synthase F0 subunit B [Oscillospiraceae bacterium]
MLSINVSELIWTIVNFFLLYFLLKHFLYTPVSRFLDARQARLDEAKAKEAEARAAAEENEKEIEAGKALHREKAAELLAEAQRVDAERSREAFAEAEKEAARSLEDAHAALRSEQERERASLEGDTPELADILAKRLLGEEK